MGIIDRLKGYKKEAEFKARELKGDKKVAGDRREYNYEQREKEDREFKKRREEAERKAKQLAVKDMEVSNKEKLKEINKRGFKAGPLGTVSEIGRRATKIDQPRPQRRQRRSRRQPRYDSYSYQPPQRNKNIDDIDREFDKFF